MKINWGVNGGEAVLGRRANLFVKVFARPRL